MGHHRRTHRDKLPAISIHLSVTMLLTVLIIFGALVVPSVAADYACEPCHGYFDDVHGDPDHTASPAPGYISIFPDNHHDDAQATFGVVIDCMTCHINDLFPAHAENCATCHPTPYDSLGATWSKGCQQGGCHQVYHADSSTAHLQWSDPWDVNNNCDLCHTTNVGPVIASKCLNCHATYGAGDVTPPVTSSDAQAEYFGAAKIKFSITDNGKVGIGTTFYSLDSGDVTAGSYAVASADGDHTLEYWSVDQAGNVESPSNFAYFNITEDTTPPTTVSNAQASYAGAALITLTATDNDPQGVRFTYYSLNGAAAQVGTIVNVPAPNGTVNYTLVFWSEDWSGNVESPKSALFSITSGNATIRLVWGNCEMNPSSCTDLTAASWVVRIGNQYGTIVKTGTNPTNWDGVDDISVPISSTPYFIRVSWVEADEDYWWWVDSDFYRSVTTPGEIYRINY